jgi:hypothetical protein
MAVANKGPSEEDTAAAKLQAMQRGKLTRQKAAQKVRSYWLNIFCWNIRTDLIFCTEYSFSLNILY